MKAVWDYNFFGPVLVESIGRETLLALPAWQKTELDDGGLLLEMSPSPVADWQPYAQHYREAAAALGVGAFHQGG